MSEVLFSTPAGKIEGRFHRAQDVTSPVVLVLHPNPMYGGNMNNKIVYNLYHCFVRAGCSVLRINFRCVTNKDFDQVKISKGTNEISDAAATMDWINKEMPKASSFWISGFSFGAWIAMQLIVRRPEIKSFISVSPPVNRYDFSFLSPCLVPGLIIQGGTDKIVNTHDVSQLANRLTKQHKCSRNIEYYSIENANHFFTGYIDEFCEIVDNYLSVNLFKENNQKEFTSSFIHQEELVEE